MLDRRKFLTLSGAASLGFGVSLAPHITQAAALPSPSQSHSLNAADFGLKPNSSANQSAALQTAINAAATQNLPLFIAAGSYIVADIMLPNDIHVFGVYGKSILRQRGDIPILLNRESRTITLENLMFDGNQSAPQIGAIISFSYTNNIHIARCHFYNGKGSGLDLFKCSGEVSSNKFYDLGQTALFSNDGKNLKISQNDIQDIGNNGILVWQSDKDDDGSIISNNHISKIKTNNGGNGQNGNGVNVFRANNVIVSNNRFDDCAYSAVRINAGDNCQIINNNCTNIGEVALYAEFGFNGVIINNNLVDLAGAGISITNLDQGGHLAVCKGNLLRNLTLHATATQYDDARAFGIGAEADALIEGNIVENATHYGIIGGFGEFQRNVNVLNNMIKDCGYGITPSVAPNAGKMFISHNHISNAKLGAVVGFEWDQPKSSELAGKQQDFGQGQYPNLSLHNNVVS
ncbi:MAG: TIGR03808 family TAT-translocated repetitive protein [Rhizobiales bacterium]|nr:TIGR03808 family TAT-translocated repetitive protein [Hyphomicrobiales bacterium]NRB13432.1 TIGR03808 family TAT-translocated repetitive protein [Hyphomicrobiales bacterium]